MPEVPVSYLTVDGKEYGPFDSKQGEEVRELKARIGGVIRYCVIDEKHMPSAQKEKAKVYHPNLF